jgi:TolB-like protein
MNAEASWSIAVMPFVNASNKMSNIFLTNDETLISSLSQLPI